MQSDRPFGITENAQTGPHRTALRLGDRARTFGELDDRGRRVAAALEQRGVGPDGRVAIMLPNGFEFFEVAHAAAVLGADPVPINWHLRGDEVAWILADSGAGVVISHVDLRSQLEQAIAVADTPHALVVGQGGGDDYEEALQEAGDPVSGTVMPTPAFMLYTSATTGRPKGVVREMGEQSSGDDSHDARFAIADLWGFDREDRHLLCGPAYHGGPSGWANIHLSIGASVSILERFDARAWLRTVHDHQVTTTFMVPAHLIRVLEVPEEERGQYDLSSLRLVLHGGAPCPPDVKAAFMDLVPKAEVWEFYGGSEGAGTRISPQEWRERPTSVGRPWPGIEIEIRGSDSALLGPNETGVVHFVPPDGHGRFRYNNDPAKTAEAWTEDGFTMGEVGYVDEDGYLYITDRVSDMILRGGVNIYPREAEWVLQRHPSVVDCAAFGVPDDRYGERLMAMVELREANVSPEELIAYCQQNLSTYKCPEFVEIVSELPRDPNGKVMKRLLRERRS